MQYAIVPVEGPVTFHEAALGLTREDIAIDAVGPRATLLREGQEVALWTDHDSLGFMLSGGKFNERADYLIRMFVAAGRSGIEAVEGDVFITGLTDEWVQFLTGLTIHEDIAEPA